MVIALKELLDDMQDNKRNMFDVKCAIIGLSYSYAAEDNPEYILSNPNDICTDEPVFDKIVTLKENWTDDDWSVFQEGLRFNYDDGFGSQHLFGVVWFKDGSWLERYEYDGAESWVLKSTPDIPQILQRG